MSRDHLLNSKDPKKVWNFSLARRKDLFFVFGRFFVFLWDSQHDTREEERRVGVARANIRAKRRSRKRDRKKERKKEEESIHSSVLRGRSPRSPPTVAVKKNMMGKRETFFN